MNEVMRFTQNVLYKVPFSVWMKLRDLFKMCFIKCHSQYEWIYELYPMFVLWSAIACMNEAKMVSYHTSQSQCLVYKARFCLKIMIVSSLFYLTYHGIRWVIVLCFYVVLGFFYHFIAHSCTTIIAPVSVQHTGTHHQ